MSTAHKIAITVVVLFVGISTAPAAAAAAEVGPDDLSNSEWNEVFDDTEGDEHFGGTNSVDAFEKTYIRETDSKLQFAVQMDTGVTNFDKTKNALQVYIDADGETGISDSAGSGWDYFYDGLGAMNAEYRISKSNGFTAKIQEHNEDVRFDNLGDVDYEASTDTYRFEIDKETIGDPDEFDVKFAYAQNAAKTTPGEIAWAPKTPVRVSDGSSAPTASVEVTAEFGTSNFDEGASAEFALTNDGETVATESADIVSGFATQSFSVNPNNFDGTVNASVVVNGDEKYAFERDVDNRVKIADNGLSGGTTSRTIHISVIQPEVTFGNAQAPADGASVEFTLTDKDGKQTVRSVGATTPVVENFTVNPNNFDDTDSKLTVDVSGDSDFPYNATRSVGVSENSDSVEEFDASEIGHKINLDPDSDARKIGDKDTFTVGVDVNSSDDTGGKEIYYLKHVIDFDSENLKNDVSNISTSINNPDNGAIIEEVGVNDGSVTVVIVAEGGLGNGAPIVTNDTDPAVDLYDITFEFEDGLQGELEQGDGVIEFEPTTNEDTELTGSSKDDELNFRSSSNPVDIDNDQVRVTEAEITPISEYGNMKGFTSQFEIFVNTNNGSLGDITLDGSSNTTTINCNSESSCTKTVEYTPDENTALGGNNYDEDYEFEVAVKDGSGDPVTTITESDVEADGNDITGDLDMKVYKKGDFNGNGQTDGIGKQEVRAVIQELGEGNGEPWGEDQADLARLDVTGDGEISITDITTIIDEL